MKFFCVKCQKEFQKNIFHTFCECGGFVDVSYEDEKIHLENSDNPYIRYKNLLPIKDNIERLPKDTTYTPLVHAKSLGKFFDLNNLFLKNETVLPTKSTKDRMANVSLAYLFECGVRDFCTSSTGNSSTSYAHGINNFPEMTVNIFTAENFIQRLNFKSSNQIKSFGLRGASFVEAFEYSGIYANSNQLTSEKGFFNLGRREGLKLAFMESCEQITKPIDWYVQAISSAMGVYGTYKGAKEMLRLKKITKLPSLMCVQQESCSPMVKAYKNNSEFMTPEFIIKKPFGIADAILRGDPTKAYPHIRKIVEESQGDFVSANEIEIREARKILYELEGLDCCFSAATAVAGVIKKARAQELNKNDVIMINITGADRPKTPAENVTWLTNKNNEWTEEN